MSAKLDLIKTYFKLLERFASDPAEFEPYVHSGMRQHEFPNLLNREGQISDLADMLRRAALGKKILARQTFEVINSVESGDQVVVEATWRGTMGQDAGPLKAGQELKAAFCIVCEFKDGKIFRQRNYDCFEPF